MDRATLWMRRNTCFATFSFSLVSISASVVFSISLAFSGDMVGNEIWETWLCTSGGVATACWGVPAAKGDTPLFCGNGWPGLIMGEGLVMPPGLAPTGWAWTWGLPATIGFTAALAGLKAPWAAFWAVIGRGGWTPGALGWAVFGRGAAACTTAGFEMGGCCGTGVPCW